MRIQVFITLLLLSVSLQACGYFKKSNSRNDIKWLKTDNGLHYSIVKDVPGEQRPGLGDYLEFHIRSHVGDSVVFDSRAMNNNEPVPFQLSSPAFKGDLTEGLMMLTEGDSALFMVPVDSLMSSGNQMLPWMQTGKKLMMQYEIKVVRVFTPAQLKAHRKNMAEKQLLIDDVILKAYLAEKKTIADKTASGIYYTISKKGKGAKPMEADSVTINYTGRLLDGTVFDSNTDPAFNHVEPLGFKLGLGQVIKGWDEGIALFNKGTKATLYIPSIYAYGSQSPGPQIPANAIMVFDIEVVNVFKL